MLFPELGKVHRQKFALVLQVLLDRITNLESPFGGPERRKRLNIHTLRKVNDSGVTAAGARNVLQQLLVYGDVLAAVRLLALPP